MEIILTLVIDHQTNRTEYKTIHRGKQKKRTHVFGKAIEATTIAIDFCKESNQDIHATVIKIAKKSEGSNFVASIQ